MSDHAGRFVWYDLMTTDVAAAKAFYGPIIGWTMLESPLAAGYTVLHVGETPVAGLMMLPPEVAQAGARPHWQGYIGVADVDAAAAKLAEAGGTVHHAPGDIPHVGRFAAVADPQGAHFILFRGAGTPPEPIPHGTPGTVGWRELHAVDGATAFDFYAAQFGWAKAEAHDMGPMGLYQLVSVGGAMPMAGMMTRMSADIPPHWNYYINVADINAAAEAVKAGGGQVVNGPMEVPGGQWVLQGFDPQGAFFALVAPH